MSTMKNQTDLEREKLPAEVTFDKRVYGGISYFGQAITGSALTYWIRHSTGRPIFDKIAEWVGPNFISKITSKKGVEAIKEADSWIVVSTMVFVGTLFVAPVKWLEDKKAETVEKWTNEDNAKRTAQGEVIPQVELDRQQDLLKQLKESPKQSWLSLGIGRFASLVPVYAALYAIGKPNNRKMEEAFQSATSTVAEAIGMKELAKSKTFHRASGIAFYDGFYSMISAGGLYVFSKLSAGFGKTNDTKFINDIAEHEPLHNVTEHVIDTPEHHAKYHSTNQNHKPLTHRKTESFVEHIKPQDTNSNLQMAL
jgi:hypothetical protein